MERQKDSELYIYIYIYIERERERGLGGGGGGRTSQEEIEDHRCVNLSVKQSSNKERKPFDN